MPIERFLELRDETIRIAKEEATLAVESVIAEYELNKSEMAKAYKELLSDYAKLKEAYSQKQAECDKLEKDRWWARVFNVCLATGFIAAISAVAALAIMLSAQ